MIFLDVGAHEGQTLEVVCGYDFERIWAFEPMPVQYARLVERFGDEPNVKLLNCGLADRPGWHPVYGTNEEMEASIYPDKEDVDPAVVTQCQFIRAREFFADNVSPGAVVKLNCEGAEVPILNDLIDSGEIWKIANLMVDFDVRRIESMKREEPRVLDRLRAIGFDRYSLREDVMLGDTHAERIGSWLGWP